MTPHLIYSFLQRGQFILKIQVLDNNRGYLISKLFKYTNGMDRNTQDCSDGVLLFSWLKELSRLQMNGEEQQ